MATTIGDLQVLIRGDATSLLSAISKSVSSLGAVEAAAAGAVGGFALLTGAVVSSALEYDRAFTRIDALSNANAESIGRWRQEVLALAGETAQAPQELADALFFLSSAGLETSQVMDALEASAKASAVGLGDTADIAKITAQVMNAYAESGITATEVTDTLVAAIKAGTAEPEEFAGALGRVISIAAKAGVEFDQVAASLAGLSNVGIDVNEGVTAMTGLLTSMVAPTKATQTAMAELGISTEDLRQVLSEDGLLAAMQLLEERSGGNLDVLKALIPNVRALRGQLGLTGDNAEQVAGIFDQVANSSGALAEALGVVQESPGFRFDQIKTQVQVLAIELGEKLLPLLEDLLPMVADIASVVGDVLVPAMDSAADAARPLTDAFGLISDAVRDVQGDTSLAGDLVASMGQEILDAARGPVLTAAAAHGEYAENLEAAREALAAMESEQAGFTLDRVQNTVDVLQGLWDDYVEGVNAATEAEKRHAAALGLTASVMREAAGGLLGLIEAARTYADAQDEVTRLEKQGKEGTREYRDAVADLLRERLELSTSIGELQAQWREEGVSLADAKAALEQVGRQAGLTGGALQRFISSGLAPVRDELDGLTAGSPYKAEAKLSVEGEQQLETLQYQLHHLEENPWIVNVAVHTEARSPWPDEALRLHLTDPLRKMGFRQIAGRWTLPIDVGVHTTAPRRGADLVGATVAGERPQVTTVGAGTSDAGGVTVHVHGDVYDGDKFEERVARAARRLKVKAG